MELFEQIRREYEHGGGTIRGIAKKLGMHRRMVREAVLSAVPVERKTPVRERPKHLSRPSGGQNVHTVSAPAWPCGEPSTGRAVLIVERFQLGDYFLGRSGVYLKKPSTSTPGPH